LQEELRAEVVIVVAAVVVAVGVAMDKHSKSETCDSPL